MNTKPPAITAANTIHRQDDGVHATVTITIEDTTTTATGTGPSANGAIAQALASAMRNHPAITRMLDHSQLTHTYATGEPMHAVIREHGKERINPAATQADIAHLLIANGYTPATTSTNSIQYLLH